MVRTIAASCLILALSASLSAGEVCVACDKPAAVYRCTLEQPTRNANLQLGEKAERHVCEKVLATTGPHESCQIVLDAKPCNGVARTVTLTQYQQAIAGDGESTYQPGVLELARRSVNATWVCVTSLFNDC